MPSRSSLAILRLCRIPTLFGNGARSCSGVVISEFAIACPFLVILMLGVVQAGTGLTAYSRLAQIASEGTRLLGRYPALDYRGGRISNEGDFARGSALDNSCAAGSVDQRCPYVTVFRKIENLVTTYLNDSPLVQPIPANDIHIEARFFPWDNDSSSTAEDEDTVLLQVQVPYRGVISFLSGFPMTATAQSPYLFEITDSGGTP